MTSGPVPIILPGVEAGIGDSRSTVHAARMRAAAAFVALAAGVAMARWLGPVPAAACFAATAVCLGVAAAGQRMTGVALLVAMMAFGAGWFGVRVESVPRDSLARILEGDRGNAPLTVRGVVLTTPRMMVRERSGLARFVVASPRARFDLEVDSVLIEGGAWQGASGRLWVRVEGEELPAVRAGDRVRLTGLVSLPGPPTNPGEQDIRPIAAERGFVGSLSLSGPGLIAADEKPSGFAAVRAAWLAATAALNDRAHRVVENAAGDDPLARSMLAGLLLGDDDPAQRDVYNAFARQGLVHILSISGFHLSALAMIALGLLRLSGDRGWLEPVILAAVILLYCAMLPPASPILRSAAMVLIILLADALGRRYDAVTLLIWIGAGLLVWRPMDLWSVGYQLSLGLTLALLWLTPKVKPRLFTARLKGTVREHPMADRLVDHVQESVAANLVCWLVAAPVVACRMGVLSPLAFATSFVVGPLVMVVLAIGYVALMVGMVVPAAAGMASGVLSWLTTGAVAVVRFADAWTLSAVYLPPLSGVWALGATVCIVIVLAVPLRGWKGKPLVALLAAGVLVAWTGLELGLPRRLPAGTRLRIDTLDVDNGTCHFLRSGGETLMWDCGSLSSAGVQARIIAAARELGVNKAPTAVVTHPDIDHYAGILDAVRPLGIKRVLVPRRFLEDAKEKPRGPAAEAVRELERAGVQVRAAAEGETLALGGVTLRFLSPPRECDWDVDNDHSLVAEVRGERGESLALMTGDIQDAAVARLAEAYPALRPAVLEVPHHGSAREPAIRWVEALNPVVAIQSTGQRRAGDPRWAAVRSGRVWMTTALDGACWVEVGDAVRAGSILGSGR